MPVFHTDTFLHNLFSYDYAAATGTTVWISLAAMALGLVIGTLIAIGRETSFLPLTVLATVYLWIFRGTPVLLQIVFAFNVLPAFGLVLSAYACAVLALGLAEGAYISEIMRAGIRAISKDQREAGSALGLRPWQTMWLIVLPQAIRIVIPPIGNQFIGMLKLSALVSVIGVRELLLTAEQAASFDFRYLEALSAAGLIYLALTSVFTLGQAMLEKALRPEAQWKQQDRALPPGTVENADMRS